jgi:hypothetical protein
VVCLTGPTTRVAVVFGMIVSMVVMMRGRLSFQGFGRGVLGTHHGVQHNHHNPDSECTEDGDPDRVTHDRCSLHVPFIFPSCFLTLAK